jgi:hypothetical protein
VCLSGHCGQQNLFSSCSSREFIPAESALFGLYFPRKKCTPHVLGLLGTMERLLDYETSVENRKVEIPSLGNCFLFEEIIILLCFKMSWFCFVVV